MKRSGSKKLLLYSSNRKNCNYLPTHIGSHTQNIQNP